MNDPSPSHTHPSLLVRLRDARDAGAWQLFVDAYGPLVYRYCRRKGLQDADAADVTQEVLAEVNRCICAFQYQPERGRFRDWLGTVTRRRLCRFQEKRCRGPVSAGAPADGQAADTVAGPVADAEWTDEFNARVLRVALDRVRGHFEEATWRAFERVWLDGRPAPEAARELGVSLQKVYVAKSRVLKRLEEEVRVLAEDAPPLVPLR